MKGIWNAIISKQAAGGKGYLEVVLVNYKIE